MAGNLESMKALRFDRLGELSALQVQEIPTPQISEDEVLVRVHVCGICATDLKKIETGSHSAPRIFGHETAGQVVAIGDDAGPKLIRRQLLPQVVLVPRQHRM